MRENGIWYGVHPHSPQLDDADSRIFAAVDVGPGDEGFEILGAKALGRDEYKVCHIPCYAFGLSLGDIVRTDSYLGKDSVVFERIKRSGHSTMRVAFFEQTPRDEILRLTVQLGALCANHELCSEHWLGLDLADRRQIESVEFLGEASRQWSSHI